MVAEYVPPLGEYLVASAADRTLGTGAIRRLEPGVYEVKNLWVRPAARGRGVARGILDTLESDALGFGATRLRLDTHRSLAAAIALYRSAGFVEVPPYNDNHNATHWFEKQLAR